MNTILIERIDIMTAREGQQLWKPTDTEKQTANITKFMNHINKKENKNLQYYQDIWNWSVNHWEDGRRYVVEWFDVEHGVEYEKVTESSAMIEKKWFRRSELNDVENIVNNKYKEQAVMLSKSERHAVAEMNWNELEEQVASLSTFLR